LIFIFLTLLLTDCGKHHTENYIKTVEYIERQSVSKWKKCFYDCYFISNKLGTSKHIFIFKNGVICLDKNCIALDDEYDRRIKKYYEKVDKK